MRRLSRRSHGHQGSLRFDGGGGSRRRDQEIVLGISEIGQVLAGDIPGRRSAEEITLYKSLGHIVQDLASLAAILD